LALGLEVLLEGVFACLDLDGGAVMLEAEEECAGILKVLVCFMYE